MDERRRTISSEEQMIGEALMRVSNTLEAQRLTKSLDYQEKLRSRSNIRLIIAIICLFTAMMMMMISGALLFVLWRYADPVLDTVVPFLKSMMGDFGVIWDGLVETLSYVPVMVEQLTRLLEQVIIMLEGLNAIDLAGIMGKLGGMLDGMLADLQPLFDKIGELMDALMNDGIAGVLEALGMNPETVAELIGGIDQLLDASAKSLAAFAGTIDPEQFGKLGEAMGEILGDVTEGLSKVEIDPDKLKSTVEGAVTSTEKLVDGLSTAMTSIGNGLEENADTLEEGTASAVEGLGNALDRLGTDLTEISEEGLIPWLMGQV